MEVVLQVRVVALLLIPAFGAELFSVMVIVSVSEQPLAAVTVSVYVPALVMFTELLVPKALLQE